MEPVSASSIVFKAAGAIQGLVDRATKIAAGDAEYYGAWLGVAGQAVKGIEEEYLGILRQAAAVDLEDRADRRALLARIRDYVDGEVLRPRLDEAIRRLAEGRAALAEHADRLLILGRTAEKRQRALAHFDYLLSMLSGYLGSLGKYDGPSAAGLKDVLRMRELLGMEPFDLDGFEAFVEGLLEGFDKSALISATGECGRVIEALRIAFR